VVLVELAGRLVAGLRELVAVPAAVVVSSLGCLVVVLVVAGLLREAVALEQERRPEVVELLQVVPLRLAQFLLLSPLLLLLALQFTH
jgi:hypothetical protein